MPENLGVAQLMDVKQFPDQRDDQGRMRVVLILAFGERNVAPPGSEDGDVQFLDTWLLIKVVEVFICDTPHTSPDGDVEMEERPYLAQCRPEPSRGHIETIVPSTRHELIRGRAVRLFSSKNEETGEIQDQIALFGIFLGARIQAIVMTSPLFVSSLPESIKNISLNSNAPPSPRKSNWKCALLGKTECLEASCLALFPPQSDFEHLLVVLDRKGNGEIWDWRNVAKVAELNMDNDPKATGDREEVEYRRDLHYWGVQVNWTVEEPLNNLQESINLSPHESGHRQHGDFRIVALADGQNKEWEVCWWHVGEQELRKQLVHVSEQLLREKPGQTPLPGHSWRIPSSSRHFEISTEFRTWPSSNSQQDPAPEESRDKHLMFIAYLIWDHYRIALTSQYGLCLFDMDQELPGDILETEPPPGDGPPEVVTEQVPRSPQWVTMIEDSNDDPLIDIATVGDCLFLTRKYSHMIWPFRGVLGKQTLYS
ncbi:hypothetical protein BGX31_001204 [Mortierella sp. GBA43]|nr:hypothetical protein BGX31_001204 [Mortierella sp. GBA43]